MTYLEDSCMLLGMPLLLVFLILCFHYNWYKLMVSVLVILGISVPLYFSLATYQITQEADGVHVHRRCDFNRSREQVGDSITTLRICNVINEFERNKHYQPYVTIHILHLKNGHVAVYSGRRCFLEDSPFVEICKFEDSKGYIVDLLQYVDLSGDTLYWDTYRNETVEDLAHFVLPSYYIDPTVYVTNCFPSRHKQTVDLSPEIRKYKEDWFNNQFALREELDTLDLWCNNGDTNAFLNAFRDTLKFGTAGLREKMGPGTNRMNKFTVALATQGFANYLIKTYPDSCLRVVVGYDCRHNSQVFANVVADVFSANGIYVYLFDDMRPTPEISFALRALKCVAGVNITASHNTKEYNGYKAYWADGGQIVPPIDDAIVKEASKLQANDILHKRNQQLVEIIGDSIDKEYIAVIDSAILDTVAFKKASELKIVYSPMHGAGYRIVPACLEAHGIHHVRLVEKQLPDSGKFASVARTRKHEANPEDEEAMKLLRKRAKREKADLAVATDPDADRFGFFCKDSKGTWRRIDGHQSTMLFTQYIINTRNRLHNMPAKPFMGRTIVTSELVKRIARDNGITMYDEYTGFKWLAHRIDALSKLDPASRFIGGGEESFCYLPYDKARDKDAPASICLLAEMTAEAQMRGTTLWDDLMAIYAKYGFQREYTLKWTIQADNNKSWKDNTVIIMDLFRNNIHGSICGYPIRQTLDYAQDSIAEKRGMPKTENTLQYFTQNGIKLTIRPSGTEPKLKVYMEIPSDRFTSPKKYKTAVNETKKIKNQIEQELQQILKDNKYTVL